MWFCGHCFSASISLELSIKRVSLPLEVLCPAPCWAHRLVLFIFTYMQNLVFSSTPSCMFQHHCVLSHLCICSCCPLWLKAFLWLSTWRSLLSMLGVYSGDKIIIAKEHYFYFCLAKHKVAVFKQAYGNCSSTALILFAMSQGIIHQQIQLILFKHNR